MAATAVIMVVAVTLVRQQWWQSKRQQGDTHSWLCGMAAGNGQIVRFGASAAFGIRGRTILVTTQRHRRAFVPTTHSILGRYPKNSDGWMSAPGTWKQFCEYW